MTSTTAPLPDAQSTSKTAGTTAIASTLDEPELLRYRSNLLGSDLRITNFAGGNTSSKDHGNRPAHRRQRRSLWVKGSGGDLGSIKRTGLRDALPGQAAGP
jgi:rhamnose utilization protein RhaD (predicted bifunctional aldolase and dehydrogenase)